MAIGESPCPTCGEPLQAGSVPPHCPLAGEAPCPLVSRATPPPILDPLGETIAFLSESDPDGLDDGFPVVDDLIGRSLGQYRMGEVIGRGSMGRVYQGEHSGLARTCAIKVMNPGLVVKYRRSWTGSGPRPAPWPAWSTRTLSPSTTWGTIADITILRWSTSRAASA